MMQAHPGRYAQLLSHTHDTVDLEIMRDLNRTFPNHVFFHQVGCLLDCLVGWYIDNGTLTV